MNGKSPFGRSPFSYYAGNIDKSTLRSGVQGWAPCTHRNFSEFHAGFFSWNDFLWLLTFLHLDKNIDSPYDIATYRKILYNNHVVIHSNLATERRCASWNYFFRFYVLLRQRLLVTIFANGLTHIVNDNKPAVFYIAKNPKSTASGFSICAS